MLRLGFHARVNEQSVTEKPTNRKIKVGVHLHLNRSDFGSSFLKLMDMIGIIVQS